ncbi:MAG: hypothetical protein H7210_02395, partial [Pyrinomonadaceae bacterium]|nr:hypothetical protein [Phycisphaerales bacterium]
MFQEANQLSEKDVAALLDDRCGEDAELRAEVVALLEVASAGEGPINTGVGMMRLAREVCPDEEVAQGFGRGLRAHLPRGDDGVPTLSGQYRILRVLGEGGMGTVYEAEQLSPRRLVALKAIRRGF